MSKKPMLFRWGRRAKQPEIASASEELLNRGRLRDAIRTILTERERRPSRDDDACKKLFEQLRKRCPHLLPKAPLAAGAVGEEIALDARSAGLLLVAAARRASGGAERVIWQSGPNALEVLAGRVGLQTADGRALVTIPVRCDQTGEAKITVAFAVGSTKRPAGMIAVVSGCPAGPPAIVNLWGEALTAFAWGALMDFAQDVAAESGQDQDRAGLIPGALFATPDGLSLLPMARHSFDRRAR